MIGGILSDWGAIKMIEQNPWKTPFGKLLIGSSVVAAVVGFSLAAGFAAYFQTEADPPQAAYSDPEMQAADTSSEPAAYQSDDAYTSAQRSVVDDPHGYAAVLNDLSPATTDVESTAQVAPDVYEDEVEPGETSPPQEAAYPVAATDTQPSQDPAQ